MANRYVRSTDGSNSDNGTTWALAKATLAGAASAASAGDRIFVSHVHAESGASDSGITFSFPGSYASPNQVLCGNDGAEPPTSLAATGSITSNGQASITLLGCFYLYGLKFFTATGGGACSLAFDGGADNIRQTAENCELRLVNNSTETNIVLGASNSDWEHVVDLIGCGFRFANSSQKIKLRARSVIRGCYAISGGTSPTNICSVDFPGADTTFEGCDFSAWSSGVNLVESTSRGWGRVVFRNCKLPASWSGSLGVPGIPGLVLDMINCDSGDTNYRRWRSQYEGTTKSETTVVRTGGASDGTTAWSWKMATTANAKYPLLPLPSPELFHWNDTTCSSVTVTVEIVTDNVTLKDDEAWLDIQYLGTSGYPLALFANDCKASPIATAADQTSSSATWTTTGLTTPVKQKLSVSFTPQEKGFIVATIRLAKASTTMYACPKLDVS
jgi:hypothetical protein